MKTSSLPAPVGEPLKVERAIRNLSRRCPAIPSAKVIGAGQRRRLLRPDGFAFTQS